MAGIVGLYNGWSTRIGLTRVIFERTDPALRAMITIRIG